jgi:porphyrinogen peroxidase
LLHAGRKINAAVSSAFDLDSVIDGFMHDTGRDLTGYLDGTENPKGQKATDAAIVRGQGSGLHWSSFVAVQQWVHDFQRFDSMSSVEQDNSVGRRRSDNEELIGAPPSSHVKRTAQRVFRRRLLFYAVRCLGPMAMPAVWTSSRLAKSFDAFEAQLKRMVGAEDGITDALF